MHERFSIGCKVMVCMTQCATIPRLSWYLNTETLIQNCYEFVVPQPTRLANVPSQNIPNQRTTARHVPPNTWELRFAPALLIDKVYCHCDAPAAAQTRNNNYTSTPFRGQSSIISSLILAVKPDSRCKDLYAWTQSVKTTSGVLIKAENVAS